jgi:hypothetical protein
VGHCVFTNTQLLAAASAWSAVTNADGGSGRLAIVKGTGQMKVANRKMWQVSGVNGDGAYVPPALKDTKTS